MGDFGELLRPADALRSILDSASAKFVESVDVVMNLSVDPRRSDEQVRGVVVLPHGLGSEITVAVFSGDMRHCDLAKEAGAELVGGIELVEEIKSSGKISVDWCVASPSFMPTVSSIAKILGPRGLMPNPKFNTVTDKVSDAVKIIKSGQVRFKADRGGSVHGKIGNVKFDVGDLLGNFEAFLGAVRAAKPESVKHGYVKSVYLSTTMGSAVNVLVS